MKKFYLLALTFMLSLCLPASAQMAFTFSDVEITTKDLTDGTTLVEFPIGTDLSTVMQSVSVTVDGETVSNDKIVPNPSSVSLEDDEKVIFYYNGKGYQFHFSEGKYFTAIMLSDSHVKLLNYTSSGSSKSGEGYKTTTNEMYGIVQNMVKMGKEGGSRFQFNALPGYVPTCDIAFNLGDMDGDNVTTKSNTGFPASHSPFYKAGIPLVVMSGNHDRNSYSTLSSTMNSANQFTMDLIDSYLDTLQMLSDANNLGIEVERFTDGTSRAQVKPWTFKFNGIRFYCGQTYFFENTVDESSNKYYAPDGVIDALRNYVYARTKDESEVPTVWMQHYSIYNYRATKINYLIDYYWTNGYSEANSTLSTKSSSNMTTADESIYYTHKSINSSSTAAQYAQIKRDSLLSLMSYTKNPTMFSGHAHEYFERDVSEYGKSQGLSANKYYGKNGSHIMDYTVTSAGESHEAFIVLFKGNKGVIEVQKASFYAPYNCRVDKCENNDVEFDATASNQDNAILANMVTSLEYVDESEFSTAVSTAETAASEDDVTSAINTLDKAFVTYLNNQGTETVDVSKLLGENLDFSTTATESGSTLTSNTYFSNVYAIPNWNTHVASRTSSASNIKVNTNSSSNAGGTSPEFYGYVTSQDTVSTVQILKQAALPTKGTYTLSFNTKCSSVPNTSLCYYEVNGERKTVSLSTSQTSHEFTITVDKPSLFTLSLGFFENKSGTAGLYADDVKLTITDFEASSTTPTLSAEESSLDFGTVTVGDDAVSKTIIVTGTDLTGDVTAVSNNEAYTVNVTAGENDGEYIVIVTFNPSEAGTYDGTITISSEGATDIEVAVSGTAQAALRSYTLNVSSYGVATMYLDYAVEIPEDENILGVFYATSIDASQANMNLERIKTGYIPKETGVIVMANKKEYTFTETTEEVETITNNILEGSIEAINVADAIEASESAYKSEDGTNYLLTLGMGDKGYIGFYIYSGTTLAGNKAYLVYSSGVSSKSDDSDISVNGMNLTIVDNDATGIENVLKSGNEDIEIFDLQGRKVAHPSKGIYIINGKKHLIR